MWARYIRLLVFVVLVLFFLAGIIVWQTRVSNSQNHLGEVQKKAQAFADQCQNNRDWRDCYGNLFYTLNKANPLSFSLQVLNALQDIDPQTRDCHIPAHKMMQAEVEKNPKNWQPILGRISYTSCNYGFVHGLMEGVAHYNHSFQINEKTIPQICALMVKYSPHSGIDTTCSHIFGHLLLTDNYVGNVPDSIKLAVGICDKVPSLLQHECFAGIFMESFTRDNLVYEGLTGRIAWSTPPVIAQQEQICRQYVPPASYGCWQEISHMYNAEFSKQPKKVFSSCSHAPDADDRNYCYLHAVATLINNRDGDKHYFATLCAPFASDKSLTDRCISTAVYSEMYASVKNTDLVVQYCQALSWDAKKSCYAKVAGAIRSLVNKNNRGQFCQQLPSAYQKTCGM